MQRTWGQMPLWIRVYLLTFGLSTVIILFFSYPIIAASSEHSIQREYSRSLDRHVMFASAMKMYAASIEKMAFNPGMRQDLLTRAAQNYGWYYADGKSHIAMTGPDGEELYSSLSPEDEKLMDLNPPKDGRRSFVIRQSGERSVLFVSGWMSIAGELYRLDYENDVTDMIAGQRSLTTQISLWFSAGMILLGVGLYFLISHSLKPLAQLSAQAKALARGNYDPRIEMTRQDEIGQLAMEFNHMADAVQAHMELLRREVKDRETLIASLAHEVKTPLTSIMGYASLLENYELNEADKQKALHLIHLESKRLDDLSKKLLNLFRLGNERVVLRKEPVRVSLLLEHLERISKLSLARKGQSLVSKSIVETVVVDEELLQVLLNNLVENASKASDYHESILLSVYTEGELVVFCVRDRGCGIPVEHLGDVFQPFFVLDTARNRKYSGHGLGLSLCKAIAEAHGGSISIVSRCGEGTSVYIRVPNGQVLQNDDRKQTEG
ncbi:sensor histidine kinase [Brevibacillus nitrificans]|uniref:histidine kinase n=1 Tax=Brevibacillus nitrificans TaxID=651560 RepID=A0A3M8CQN8_9BACL|nr:HAMP domain-containing sensor histidine kinase [Brevibacillus nitrificans]RNB78096.1 sensor histidine kinase [Brevibacillus nitrificans]